MHKNSNRTAKKNLTVTVDHKIRMRQHDATGKKGSKDNVILSCNKRSI